MMITQVMIVMMYSALLNKTLDSKKIIPRWKDSIHA